MKAIQMMIDPDLLASLDATEEVKREGRSAVLRRAAAEYLERQRREEIHRRYRQAYRGEDVNAELEGWHKEGVWPPE